MEPERCAFCDTPADTLSFSADENDNELKFCDIGCLRSYVRQQKLMRYLP